MLKINILVFKENGKFYSNAEVEHPADIKLWSDEFKPFIRDNLPADLEEGYVVVVDQEGGEGFHTALYKSNELRNGSKRENKLTEEFGKASNSHTPKDSSSKTNSTLADIRYNHSTIIDRDGNRFTHSTVIKPSEEEDELTRLLRIPDESESSSQDAKEYRLCEYAYGTNWEIFVDRTISLAKRWAKENIPTNVCWRYFYYEVSDDFAKLLTEPHEVQEFPNISSLLSIDISGLPSSQEKFLRKVREILMVGSSNLQTTSYRIRLALYAFRQERDKSNKDPNS